MNIQELMVEWSSHFGDFIESRKRLISKLFVDVTTGSIPERKKCECDEMECTMCRLHDIEMHGPGKDDE